MTASKSPLIAKPIDKAQSDFSKKLLDNPCVIAALKPLKPVERRFAIARGIGNDMEDSARAAGYKGKHCRISGYRLLQKNTGIQKAIDLIELEAAFLYGIPAAMKRIQLYELFQMHKKDAPAAAVSAMKLLAQLDGDIINEMGGKGSITINITGLDIEKQIVISGDRIVSEQ